MPPGRGRPVQSVNDPAVSVWKFVDCMEVDLLHPPRKWVVWWTLRCAFGVDQAGLPVIGQSFLENAVVGVFWPLPSGPASSPMKCILPTMKVFHVVYNAPPPISLVLHLNMNDYHRVLMALTAKTEISWKSNHFRTSKWSHFTLRQSITKHGTWGCNSKHLEPDIEVQWSSSFHPSSSVFKYGYKNHTI